MTLRVKVAEAWDETSDIRCFALATANGEQLPPPEPGAHIDVHVGDKLIRQYSLWNGPEDDKRYLIGVKREMKSRGGSVGMHDIPQGRELTISAPRNNFPLVVDGGDRSLLMAGGIGITPLLSMARHLKGLGKPFDLHFFTRSVQDTPFKTVFDDLGSVTLHPGLESPEREDTVEAVLKAGKESGAQLYTCGPQPFMALVVATAEKLQWTPEKLHLEYFSAEAPASTGDETAIEVVLAKSNKVVIVAPDQSITDALQAAGIDILTSCEQGVCGTCLTKVLEGEPDHHDVYLSPAERQAGKVMLPCVSRCKGSRLVLDL